jgi:hypothetical protein
MRFKLVLIGLTFALALASSTRVEAQTSNCIAVRQTRALARRSGLDAPNLASLEQLTCGGPLDLRSFFIVPRPSADCVRITQMYAFAMAVESEDVAQIDGTRAVACRTGVVGEMDEWPNGQRIRHGTAWFYPNGARYSAVNRILMYPTGETARDSSGTWHYPGGLAVDPDSRRYHLPDGRVVESESELLSWGCARVGSEACGDVLDSMPAAWAEMRGALITMMLWLGRVR